MVENELNSEKSILTESSETSENDDKLKNSKRQSTKNDFKVKECSVISYNKHSKTLDIMFDNYGIRLKNIETFTENTINIKYKGELGRPDFEIKL